MDNFLSLSCYSSKEKIVNGQFVYIYPHIIIITTTTYWLIGLVGSVFANGPGDQDSIPSRVIPKIFKKWYLIPPCLALSNIRYVTRVKWSNPGKWVAPSPTPRCSSYWKWNLRVAHDYVRQLYLLLLTSSCVVTASLFGSMTLLNILISTMQ